MNFRELVARANQGTPVAVEYKKPLNDADEYAEPGMRVLITGGIVEEHDLCKLYLDFTPYDEFNKQFEQSNFYDKARNPVLTAREAGFYEIKTSTYVDPGDDVEPFLTLIDNNSNRLLTRHQALPEPRPSYVSWLEAELTKLEAAQGAN